MTIEIHMSGIKLTECKIFKFSAFIILPRPMTFYLLLAWLVVNENEVRFYLSTFNDSVQYGNRMQAQLKHRLCFRNSVNLRFHLNGLHL